jgi:hypothetical protein
MHTKHPWSEFDSDLCYGSQTCLKVKVKLSLSGTTLWTEMGERRYSSMYAFDFGTGWRRMVSFTPRSLGPFRRRPPNRTYHTGGWVDPRVRLDVSYNKTTAPPAKVLRFLGRLAPSLVSIRNGLSEIPIIPPIHSSKKNRGRGVSHRTRATDRIKMCGLCYANW